MLIFVAMCYNNVWIFLYQQNTQYTCEMAHNIIMIIIIIYIYKCIQDIYCVDFVSIVYQQFGGAFAFVYPINEIKVKHAIACALNAVCVGMYAVN